DDPSRYVQRSIANNLNDISKDHPQLIIELCQRWLIDETDNRKWIIRHGCRSLIKLGNPAVFSLLGFTDEVKISIEQFKVEKSQINVGESLGFSFEIKSTSDAEQLLMIDYKIHHVKGSQKRTNKVFKLKTIKLEANKMIEINKKHSFKVINTRKYYSGLHTIELIVNGKSIGDMDFNLQDP
ncbi:MAG: DNA alkylation repair protein, partial [Gammaproteobacteria bacterium]